MLKGGSDPSVLFVCLSLPSMDCSPGSNFMSNVDSPSWTIRLVELGQRKRDDGSHCGCLVCPGLLTDERDGLDFG